MNVSRIDGADAEQQALHEPSDDERAGQPERDTRDGDDDAVTHHQHANPTRRGAERHANAHLARALRRPSTRRRRRCRSPPGPTRGPRRW